MSPRLSQIDALLAYLRAHPEGIDRATAEAELGICSLARRICDLNDRGHRIGKRRKQVPTRYGRRTYIAVYHLEKKTETAEAPAASVEDRSPDKDDRPVPAPSASPRRFGPPKIEKSGQRRLL